jgi:hypothetical protein
LEVLLSVLVIAVVVAFVAAPLRRALAPPSRRDDERAARLADLEARKEAKYREIRDARMDHGAGKLSDEDYRRVDEELRREAVAILRELDEAGGEG